MKTLTLTTIAIAVSLNIFAQTKQPLTVEKTFGRYTSMPSTYQVRTTDSLIKLGFKPEGIRYINGGKMIVRFIKSV